MRKVTWNHGFVMGVLLAVVGCGSGAHSDPESAFTAHLEMVVAYFEDFGEALATVQDAATANAVAQRVHDEFVPRLEAIGENMTSLVAQFGAEQIDATVSKIELPALDRRMELAMQRFERQSMRIDSQPQVLTSALEAAIMAWGMRAEQLEDVIAGSSANTGRAEPGSRDWCRQMAQKPESQWTMDEAFMFANRCMG